MLNKIIRFSLNNRIVVLVAAILLMLAGTYTATNMEVDVFPDLNAPTVVVMTEAKGMAPEEVERLVSFPVETALNGATDVRRVRSSSTTGFSIVWVEFNWGTDIYRARQIVSEKLAVVKDALPSNVGNPTLGPQSSILGELMIIGLTADSTSLQDLRTLADWSIRPRLLSTGGVAQVTVLGGDIKEYQILLNPEKMKHYGIGLDEATRVVSEMNQNASGGVLYEYGNEYIIRGVLSTNDVAALGKSLVKSTDGAPILLENIADVQIGNKAPKLGIASERGKAAVLITVTKQPATSTIELTEKLSRSLDELQATLPADVRVSTDIFRQARFIDNSINNVQKSLYEGGVFVIIVLFIFLMNVRTTVISLVTIPLALVVSILALKLMGLTINTMSLGGMAIAIGSLVDDAIVDVENVFKRLRENRHRPAAERLPVLTVVFEASKEVRMPILNSTLIIVASFVPLFFLSGMEGRMLAPLGIAFIVALFASTLVALTLTPVLCSYLLGKPQKSHSKPEREPFVVRKLKGIYEKALRWTLGHKKWVLGSTGAVLVATVVCFFTLGRSFLPPFNEGSFTINLSTLPGISLEESDKMGRIAEEMLLSIPEIQTVGRKTGRAELDEHALGVNVSEMEAPFVLAKRSKDEVLAEIREKLKALPGVNLEIGQPISHRIDAMLSGTRANIAIKLFGSDLNRMFALGNQIKAAIEDVPGIADLNVEQQVERPQLKIEPKRELLARYGISLPEFAEIINVMLAGEVVSQVYEGNRAFDLTLKVNDSSRASAESIRNLMVDAGGQKVPLAHIAYITSTVGPNTINRENVARKIVISANVAGRDLRGVVNDIREKVQTGIQLPEGYHVEYGGQFESEQAASRTLMITSIFSILVIFLLLFNQFRSVVQSSVILLNLPLALIGGVFALLCTSGVISIPAIIGFISLFGIATRNGMLLISRYNDLRGEGLSVRESVMQGSLDRLNPILMTALTSALALIPLALGGSLPGNEIQSPMAKVILGGLLTSTLLNAFIIPVMYLVTCRSAAQQHTLAGSEPAEVENIF
jgi:Cu(I)/Ag(I) efflux system membrane protein CusA/SilA